MYQYMWETLVFTKKYNSHHKIIANKWLVIVTNVQYNLVEKSVPHVCTGFTMPPQILEMLVLF